MFGIGREEERKKEWMAFEAEAWSLLPAVFCVAHHAVFVTSYLPAAENSAIARRLLPAVHQHIEKAEA